MENIVTPNTPEWDYAVFDCSPKKDDRQWRIGDWALRVFPMQSVGRPAKGKELEANLRNFAKEIDVEYNTVLQYRLVASSWKINIRILNTSFAVHQVLMSYQYLMQEGLTVKEARKLVTEEKERLEAESWDMKVEEELEPEEVQIEPEPNDDYTYSIVKANLASAVNKFDAASMAWGQIEQPTQAMIRWANRRINETIEALTMLHTAVNAQSSMDDQLSHLLDGNK